MQITKVTVTFLIQLYTPVTICFGHCTALPSILTHKLLQNMMNLVSVVMAICGFRQIWRSSHDLHKDLVPIATCQQELTPSSLFIPTKCQMDTKQHTCKLSVLIDLRSCNYDVSDTPLAVIELITPFLAPLCRTTLNTFAFLPM